MSKPNLQMTTPTLVHIRERATNHLLPFLEVGLSVLLMVVIVVYRYVEACLTEYGFVERPVVRLPSSDSPQAEVTP